MDGKGVPQLSLLGGARNGRSGSEATALGPWLTPPSLALGSVRRRPPGGGRGARGRSGGGGQARPCPGHRSARAPGRRCLPSGCGAQRAARSRSPGRCQVAGPASCLHGPGARRGGRRRPRRRRRRTSRRQPGSGPPGQQRRRRRRRRRHRPNLHARSDPRHFTKMSVLSRKRCVPYTRNYPVTCSGVPINGF